MTEAGLDSVDCFVALADGRQRLMAAISNIEDSDAERVVHGEWRVHDLLSHLAAWDEFVAQTLRAVQTGTRTFELVAAPDGEWADWNAQQVAEARDETLGQRLQRLHAAREALLQAAGALDDATLDVTLMPPWGIEETPRFTLVAQALHDAMHAETIGDLMAAAGASA